MVKYFLQNYVFDIILGIDKFIMNVRSETKIDINLKL